MSYYAFNDRIPFLEKIRYELITLWFTSINLFYTLPCVVDSNRRPFHLMTNADISICLSLVVVQSLSDRYVDRLRPQSFTIDVDAYLHFKCHQQTAIGEQSALNMTDNYDRTNLVVIGS